MLAYISTVFWSTYKYFFEDVVLLMNSQITHTEFDCFEFDSCVKSKYTSYICTCK